MNKTEPAEPYWICKSCGEKYGSKMPSTCESYHTRKCWVCHKLATVSHVGGYGYPDISDLRPDSTEIN